MILLKLKNFYKGYEGEGEIQFIHGTQTDQKIILKIWDGFFDDIMEKIEPEVTGWTSLAYYYNLVKGWYEEIPWEVPNIATALQQLSKVKGAEFRFSQTQILHP